MLAAIPSLASSAAADRAFKLLMPLLVDLPGRTGEKADGMTMETGQSGHSSRPPRADRRRAVNRSKTTASLDPPRRARSR